MHSYPGGTYAYSLLWSLHLYSFLMCARSEASGKSVLLVQARGPKRYELGLVLARKHGGLAFVSVREFCVLLCPQDSKK